MTEEKPTPPTAPLPPAAPETPGEEEEDEEKSIGLIEKANLAAVRQEEANQKHEALLNRQERMNVEKTLGGTANAGAPTQTQEQKEIAEAKEMLKGTGFEDMAFPPESKDLNR